jgi:predicted deacetylase
MEDIFMADKIVMDLDDFNDENADNGLRLLDELYAASQQTLKCTLFTIPAWTSEHTFARIRNRSSYLQLAVHGWDHRWMECEAWTYETAQEVLKRCGEPYQRIFKPPYWRANADVYRALLDAGWAVAEHPDNFEKLPPALRRYVLDSSHRIGMLHRWQPIVQAHGHVGNDCNNGLEEAFESFLVLAKSGKEFAFVSEVLV